MVLQWTDLMTIAVILGGIIGVFIGIVSAFEYMHWHKLVNSYNKFAFAFTSILSGMLTGMVLVMLVFGIMTGVLNLQIYLSKLFIK